MLRTMDSYHSLISDARSVKDSSQPKTIEELVKVLADELKGVTVSRDPQRKNIIRLTENRLSTVKNYVMSEKVTLKFSGLLREMLEELKTINSRIRPPLMHAIGTAGPDGVTETEIDVKEVSVRTLAPRCRPAQGI